MGKLNAWRTLWKVIFHRVSRQKWQHFSFAMFAANSFCSIEKPRKYHSRNDSIALSYPNVCQYSFAANLQTFAIRKKMFVAHLSIFINFHICFSFSSLLYIHGCIYMYTFTHMVHTFMYTYLHTYINAYIHIYIHLYIHKCTHIHVYIHI